MIPRRGTRPLRPAVVASDPEEAWQQERFASTVATATNAHRQTKKVYRDHTGGLDRVSIKHHITRRRFLGLAAAAGTGVGLYTWRWEPHWVAIVRRKMAVANLPDQLVGSILAHLSDLHIGPQVDDDYLRDVFQRVNEWQPEIVVYTGDFTSYHTDIFPQARRVFAHLARGSQGSFGILGNHDYGPGWTSIEVADEIASLAEGAGIQILRNETADVGGLQIIGLDELWANRFRPERAFARFDPDAASIVLSHNPDTVDRGGWGDYSGWILAGHTHGGQCKPPFLPPPLLPVQNRRYTSGEFALSGGRRMYINRGIGHLLRVRFNARPEVTLFELVRE